MSGQTIYPLGVSSTNIIGMPQLISGAGNGATCINLSGICNSSPVLLLANQSTTITVTTLGSFTVFLPTNYTGIATSGTAAIVGTPQSLVAGNNTVSTSNTGTFSISITATSQATQTINLLNSSVASTVKIGLPTLSTPPQSFDVSPTPQILQIYLCRPDLNRTTIAKLTEAEVTTSKSGLLYKTIKYRKSGARLVYVRSHTTRFGSINEINFSVPLMVQLNNNGTQLDSELQYNYSLNLLLGLLGEDNIESDATALGQAYIKNPHFNLVNPRYLIRVHLGNTIEYYIIDDVKKVVTNDLEELQCHAYGLGYMLNDKVVNGFVYTSINAQTALDLALADSVWGTGYIDSSGLVTYRSFNITSETTLSTVYSIAQSFSLVPVFNTLNMTVSLYNQNNLGVDRGFCINDGKYLDNISIEVNSNELATRLHVYGKSGLTIGAVNPTGSDYIEAYDWFMYPFAQDSNGNIISHSAYMSDQLCIALNNYQNLVTQNQNSYKTLLAQLTSYQSQLVTENDNLNNLTTQLTTWQQELDACNANGVTPVDSNNGQNLLNEIANQQALINNENNVISEINTNITNIQNQITNLKNLLAIENNFTSAEIREWSMFIVEKDYTDSSIETAEDLYQMGLVYFNSICNPPITIQVDIVNFLEVAKCANDFEKLNLGDIVTIRYDRMSTLIKAKIIQLDFDYQQGTVKLTISNIKEILTAEQKFVRNITSAVSSSATLSNNSYKYDQAYDISNSLANTINSTWDAVKHQITAGIDESVQINNRGIQIISPSNPNDQIILQAGVIALTGDGGNTWKTAILPDKIVAEVVEGKLLCGINLEIDASDVNGHKFFSVNSTGVTIDGLALTITNSDFLQQGTAYDGVVIGANGLVVTRSDNTSRFLANSTQIKIQGSPDNGITWQDKFYVDGSGNTIVNDITATGNMNITGYLKVQGTNILNELNQIQGQYVGSGINGANINAGSITATQISVTSLSAVSANLGTVTSGTIQGGIIETMSSGQLHGACINYGGYGKLDFYNTGTLYGFITHYCDIGSGIKLASTPQHVLQLGTAASQTALYLVGNINFGFSNDTTIDFSNMASNSITWGQVAPVAKFG